MGSQRVFLCDEAIHFHSLIYDSWICVGVEEKNPKKEEWEKISFYI